MSTLVVVTNQSEHTMAQVIFYENPTCAEHARQKALLRAAGHVINARDLLAEPWSVSSLRPFFAEKKINDWFDPSAKSCCSPVAGKSPSRRPSNRGEAS